MMPQANAPEGVILIDKPYGLTSHDVVDRVRKVARTRRVGHTGTLDPMATGLLVVCVGRATRIAQFLTGLPKEYEGTIKLGAISSTYDAEGDIMGQERPLPPDEQVIADEMAHEVGWIMQLPPPYSAVKVRGKKLYEYARQGEEVPQKPRRVRIHRFEMTEYCEPEIKFYARVGSGTYLRSMAHDLGIRLGCGGYLSSLRRTSVGAFSIGDGVNLKTLIDEPELLGANMLDLGQALAHLPRITIAPDKVRAVLNGQGFHATDILSCEGLPRTDETSVVIDVGGRVLSIVRAESTSENVSDDPAEIQSLFFRPVRVLGSDGEA